MSYSFSVRAATKQEASEKVVAELEKVVQQQAAHAADQEQAAAAANAFIELLADDDSKDVDVSVNGWVQTNPAGLEAASITVTASLQAKSAK